MQAFDISTPKFEQCYFCPIILNPYEFPTFYIQIYS